MCFYFCFQFDRVLGSYFISNFYFMKENKHLLALVAMLLIRAFTESYSLSLNLSKDVYIHNETSSEPILITFQEGPGNAKD